MYKRTFYCHSNDVIRILFYLQILCTLAALTVAAVNAGFIDAPGHSAYTGDVHSHHHEYAAPEAQYAYSAPSVNHVYSAVKEISHTPVHHYTAPIHENVQYAPVQKTVEYTPVIHKSVQYDHHSTPSHTLAYPINNKAGTYAPIAKTISYAPAAVFEPTHHHEPTYQHTHESVDRSNAGTVSHYGKTVSTPHSHVQKYDTRVTNEHYKIAAVPAVHYKIAPAAHHEVPDVHHYKHSTPVGLEYSQPAQVQHYSAPVQHYAAPVQHHYSHSAPVQHQYSHSAPVQHHHSHSAPVQHYTQPAPTHQYAHAAPVVAYNKAVKYSPAEAVSHTTFHSNDAQYSW